MADIEEIRKKIDRLIAEKGMNYRDVSLKIGRKDSYMQQYVKYGYPRRLKEIDRMRLAQLLGVNDADIMDDEIIASKTLNPAFARSGDKPAAENFFQNSLTGIDVLNPQINGNGDVNFLKNVIDRQFVSKNFLEELTSANTQDIKIIRVVGDSMKPTINPGDIVWFDSSYKIPEADGLYLLAAGREVVIKRVQTSPLDGTVEISSDNPKYKPYNAQNYKNVRVLGKLICHLQKL